MARLAGKFTGAGVTVDQLRRVLEALAGELMVDLTLDEQATPESR